MQKGLATLAICEYLKKTHSDSFYKAKTPLFNSLTHHFRFPRGQIGPPDRQRLALWFPGRLRVQRKENVSVCGFTQIEMKQIKCPELSKKISSIFLIVNLSKWFKSIDNIQNQLLRETSPP